MCETGIELDLEGESASPVLDVPATGAELLEGLDLPHEDEFEDWLREQRAEFSRRGTDRQRAKQTAATAIEPIAVPDSGVFASAQAAKAISEPFDVLLVDGARAADPRVVWLGNSLLNMAAEGVRELGLARVFDYRGSGQGDGGLADAAGIRFQRPSTMMLKADTAVAGRHQLFRFELTRLDTRELVWTSILELDASQEGICHHPTLFAAANQVISVLIAQLNTSTAAVMARVAADRVPTAAAELCLAGIRCLFLLGRENFETADALFAKAYELEPRGLFLAWRAYLRTFLIAERIYDCRETVTEEALSFKRRALETEPGNSFALALAGHVETIVTRSYAVALELANRSLAVNASNPIGWAVMGTAKGHLGVTREGFENTLVARQIAGSAPYRFQLDAIACVAGTIAGEFAMAARCAEASRAAAPRFAPPLRYLTGLYLGLRREAEAEQMIDALRESEPGFEPAWLNEANYPAAGLRRSGLLRKLPVAQI